MKCGNYFWVFLSILVISSLAYADPYIAPLPGYESSSHRIDDFGTLNGKREFTECSMNRHLAVTPTDSTGNYRVYAVFDDLLTNPITPRMAVNTKNDIDEEWTLYNVCDFFSGEALRGMQTIRQDAFGNLYLSCSPGYLLKHTYGMQDNVWVTTELEDLRLMAANDYQCPFIGMSVSKNGEHAAIATHNNTVGPNTTISGGDSAIWFSGKIIFDVNSPISTSWDWKLFGGGLTTPYDDYHNTCSAVADDGRTLFASLQLAWKQMPITYLVTDSQIGRAKIIIGLGNQGQNNWKFAMDPYNKTLQLGSFTNNFSIAPFVDVVGNNRYAYLVSFDGNFNLFRINMDMDVRSGSWEEPIVMQLPVAPATASDPQIDFVRDSNGYVYMIMVYELITTNHRVWLSVWKIDPSFQAQMLWNQPITSGLEEWYNYGTSYQQVFPNVVVENKTDYSDGFDIHTLWTNGKKCISDEKVYETSEIRFRAFHFNPNGTK